MKIIKMQSKYHETIYVNVEDISFFYCENNETHISLKNGKLFIIIGDVSAKLAKIITAIKDDRISTLE